MNYLKKFKFCYCIALVLLIIIIIEPVEAASKHTDGYQEAGDPLVELNEEKTGMPSADFKWFLQEGYEKDKPYRFERKSEIPFTGLSIGIGGESSSDSTVDESLNLEEYMIKVRTKENNGQYGKWHELVLDSRTEENPSGLRWSDLYLTKGDTPHTSFEILFKLPANEEIDHIKVSVADGSLEKDDKPKSNTKDEELSLNDATLASSIRPLLFPLSTSYNNMPNIIRREEWGGDLSKDEDDGNYRDPSEYPIIDVSHAVIHHTATENEPSNPEQVVRNIWYHHAINRDWWDIGYNFLIDHEGNIYEGRENYNLEFQDVQGAHAGSGNNQASVGISLIGQFQPGYSAIDSGYPTGEALSSLEKLIAWRFSQYSLTPLGSASIGGKNNVPRICGHRDVGNTSCPGNNLYDKFSEIRDGVEHLMEHFIKTADVSRIHGDNRYRTAVEISREAFSNSQSAEVVVLARGDDFPDALAGSPFAYHSNGPLLLTPEDRLHNDTADEIERVLQSDGTVYILGGDAAISAEVQDEIEENFNHEVKRLAGDDRCETAVKIAEKFLEDKEGSFPVFMATGENFPDALAVASAAASRGGIILLSSSSSLEVKAAEFLVSYEDDLEEVYVVGGTSALSERVYEQCGAGERIAGNNRWETAVKLAERFFEEPSDVTFASGLDFPDALSGGAHAATLEAPVVLTGLDNLSEAVMAHLETKNPNLPAVNIYGGSNAIRESVLDIIYAKLVRVLY